jgi:hypothetical protein
VNENQACQSQVHMTALRYLRVKPTRRGLNRRLKPGLQGGGLVLTHYLTRDQETDGQRDTREGSSHSVFRIVEAEWPQCRRCQAWAIGVLGNWNGWVGWVKGGASGVSLQAT